MEPTPEKASDKDLVDFLEKHLAEPCGTEHGDIRQFYIHEAKRLLEREEVKDPIERERLTSAVTIAEFMK